MFIHTCTQEKIGKTHYKVKGMDYGIMSDFSFLLILLKISGINKLLSQKMFK